MSGIISASTSSNIAVREKRKIRKIITQIINKEKLLESDKELLILYSNYLNTQELIKTYKISNIKQKRKLAEKHLEELYRLKLVSSHFQEYIKIIYYSMFTYPFAFISLMFLIVATVYGFISISLSFLFGFSAIYTYAKQKKKIKLLIREIIK